MRQFLENLKELVLSISSLIFLALTAYEITNRKWHSIMRMHRQRKR